MSDMILDLKPYYSPYPKVPNVNNNNAGTISQIVKIIKENKKILSEIEVRNENLHSR